jgi:arabinogalactan oligomer/maltooligosaccharide transport system permease protein
MSAFLVTQMFPGVVMAIPLYILLDTLQLLDSKAGLVLVYATTSVPFSVFTLKGYFDTLPVALEEAAIMDGADRWTVFRRIVLPLARPALAVTALFSFMTAWNEFILAATLMSDPRSFTLPVVLQRYVDDYGTEWGHFAAGSILVSLPVVALFFALQKQFVEGLTAGAVKG